VTASGGGDPSSPKTGVGAFVKETTVGTPSGSHVGSSVLPGSGEPCPVTIGVGTNVGVAVGTSVGSSVVWS
jgi:hypothetical protein